MNKLRWGKFYWSDWSDDPALAACSLAAQGLWMRLLCIAAQGTPYGHVTINGKPPTTQALAKFIRIKVSFLTRLIAELEGNGVCSRDACGCLVSRRQEADGILFGKRSKAANSRWNKKNGSGLHMQNCNFASTEADAESHADSFPQEGKESACERNASNRVVRLEGARGRMHPPTDEEARESIRRFAEHDRIQ